MNLSSIVRRPIMTEKSLAHIGDLVRYSLEVDRRATKTQIKKAVADQFGVKVLSVNTNIRKGKTRRAARSRVRRAIPPMKKAIVTLAKGQSIELLEVKA